jgi:hypothetical protein
MGARAGIRRRNVNDYGPPKPRDNNPPSGNGEGKVWLILGIVFLVLVGYASCTSDSTGDIPEHCTAYDFKTGSC